MTQSPGERRFVAVLFADLPGLSAALESAGIEGGAALADVIFRRIRSVVERHGGFVDKFAGEGVMAVFGAPVARGDDAARAVLAAMDLRQEAAAFARERGVELGFRAGVNAGEVLWAGVAGERATAMGDAVNVAQRLQGEAAPGQILAAASVESLARRRIRFVPSGRIPVRGRVEPVEAFDCAGTRESGTGAFAGLEAPLCGREAERSRMASALAGGRGWFAWIEGEAGIGKTRLLAALRDDAAARGWTASGRAAEGGGVPLSAPGQALRQAARRAGAADFVAWLASTLAPGRSPGIEDENTAHLIALSVGETVPSARVSALDPERRRVETLFAWERWLRSRAAAGPAALFLDDLQAADPGTIALLAHLAARLRDLPVLVVASARPGLSQPEGFERIALGPLDPDSSAALAAASFRRAASPELLRFVADRAAGNPFAVVELARHLEEERLAGGDPLALVTPVEGIPRGLQPLLQARLDGLGAGTKESLKSASVLGRTFWRGLLERVAGAGVAAGIGEAARLGIVQRNEDSTLAGDEEFAFRDGLLQEAAYALLPRKDRARLHRAAAADLEELAGGGRRALALAAGHREAAGEPALASALWVRAGEDAFEAGRVVESQSFAERARKAGDTPAAKLLASRCLSTLYRYAESIEVARLACADPAATPMQVLHGRLCQANSEAGQGHLESAIRVSEEILAANPDESLQFQALYSSAYAHFHVGRVDAARAQVRRIVELAGDRPARLGPQALSGWLDTRALLAQIHIRTGQIGEALHELEELAVSCLESGRLGMRCMVLLNLGNVHYLRGELDAAQAAYDEALEVSRRNGDRVRVMGALQNLSNIRCSRGDFRGALQADLEVVRMRREVGDFRMLGSTLVNVASSRMLLGDDTGAERDIRDAVAACRAGADLYNEGTALTYLAEILHRTGREADAMQAVERVFTIAATGNFESLQAAALRLRGLLAARKDPAAAASDLDRARTLARSHSDPRLEAVSLSASAILQARQGRGAEAAALIASALSLASRDSGCGERLQVLEDAGEAHLALGDAAAARRAIEEGAAIARECGAAGFLKRFEGLAARA